MNGASVNEVFPVDCPQAKGSMCTHMALSTACVYFIAAVCPSNAAFLSQKPITRTPTVKEHLNVESKTLSNHTSLSNLSKLHAVPQNGSWQLPLSQVLHGTQAPPQQKLPVLHASNDTRNTSSQAYSPYGSGVVHFLFMVNDDLPHADIWREFFKTAAPGSWRAFVHCKDSDGCVRNGVFSNNPGLSQVPTTPTWYCHDLVTAMKQLLSFALGSNAASMGGREKFVFLSESTLPIKPFPDIHSALLLDDNSDICLFPSDQWGSASIDGSFVKLLKHHQWVVLSRDHASLFVRDWVPVNARSEWRIWLKSGTWQGRSKNIFPQSFYYPAAANTCTDEWAFMATVFGALEPLNGARYLPGFGGGHIDMDTRTTQGRCRTWTYWDNSWDQATTALASQITNDFYGSRLSCYPKCHARPATLQKLSDSSLHALRRSPFLFARKFDPTMWMSQFSSIVLTP